MSLVRIVAGVPVDLVVYVARHLMLRTVILRLFYMLGVIVHAMILVLIHKYLSSQTLLQQFSYRAVHRVFELGKGPVAIALSIDVVIVVVFTVTSQSDLTHFGIGKFAYGWKSTS
jgi:hypothetical protein